MHCFIDLCQARSAISKHNNVQQIELLYTVNIPVMNEAVMTIQRTLPPYSSPFWPSSIGPLSRHASTVSCSKGAINLEGYWYIIPRNVSKLARSQLTDFAIPLLAAVHGWCEDSSQRLGLLYREGQIFSQKTQTTPPMYGHYLHLDINGTPTSKSVG